MTSWLMRPRSLTVWPCSRGPGADGAELVLVRFGRTSGGARWRGGPAGSAADLLCRCNVLGQRVVELVDVFLAEVAAVFGALVGEGDGVAVTFLQSRAGEVVDGRGSAEVRPDRDLADHPR